MASLARGSIIYGDSAGDPAALSIGSNGTVLLQMVQMYHGQVILLLQEQVQ